MSGSRYEEIRSSHVWRVPERYNIAADVCDKHPADKQAMVWEGFDGAVREVTWGELQQLANQAAHMLPDARRRAWRPRRRRAAADAGDGSGHVRHLEAGRDPALDVGALRRRGDPAPAPGLRLDAARHRRRQRAPVRARLGADLLVLGDEALAAAADAIVTCDTAADDPAQLYYTSGTTGLAKGIVHAHRYLLGHEEFVYCHEVEDGERFHGMGEWAWAAGIAPLLGPWRLGAVQCVYQREGGFDPHKQLDFLCATR